MRNLRIKSARGACLALTLAAFGAAGCDSVFEVDNPNQLVQEDLESPQAAAALVNGAESSLARALAQVVLPLSVASDELTAIGSLDYGRQLDYGFLSNPANDITNTAFPYIAEARFMADEAITRLEAFDADGVLKTRADLARAYLYGGIVYTAVADSYDDFVISDRRAAGAPIGEAGMSALYDRAIDYLDAGLVVAQATRNRDLELSLLAQRARAKHARGVWTLLNPKGTAPAAGLVADAEAVADALAALQLAPSPDWRLQLQYGAGTVGSALGSQVNVRQEYRVSDAYAVATADNKRVASIRLLDPIDRVPDPALRTTVEAFVAAGDYPALTVVSARELHLIVAEAALAGGDDAGAAARINRVRALNSLTPYSGQVPLRSLLLHERRVHLFAQGRRLADQYRFGETDAAWQASSDAVRAPGTFLPIAQIERLSNCHIVGSCSS